MRVTQSMISGNMLRNLSSSYARLDKYNDQLASGKKINRPSDDPVVAMKGIFYRSDVTQVEQYQRNLSEAYTWTDASDDALDKVTSSLQRMRELAVQGATDTNSVDSRKAIASEINQLISHYVSLGNTQIGDKYIFNGLDTTAKPVKYNVNTLANGDIDTSNIVAGNFYTNNSDYNAEVSNGVSVAVNVNPSKIFDDTTIMKLANLNNALNNNNTTGIQSALSDLDGIIQDVLAARTKVGATQNRVEMIDDRLGSQEVIANRIMSDNEDAEIEKVITELKIQESVHNAALGVGARIIQPSLIDFLR